MKQIEFKREKIFSVFGVFVFLILGMLNPNLVVWLVQLLALFLFGFVPTVPADETVPRVKKDVPLIVCVAIITFILAPVFGSFTFVLFTAVEMLLWSFADFTPCEHAIRLDAGLKPMFALLGGLLITVAVWFVPVIPLLKNEYSGPFESVSTVGLVLIAELLFWGLTDFVDKA